jgi:DNA-binding transcriptional regulator YiaG
MGYNTAQDEAVGVDELAQRVRAAQLPSPAERAHIRRAAHVTLREFGRALGVSPMTVSRWETGESMPRLDQAARYARLLSEVSSATAAGAERLSA